MEQEYGEFMNELAYQFSEGEESIVNSRFIDALSKNNLWTDNKVSRILNSLPGVIYKKTEDFGISRKDANPIFISFIVPLDFYIPIKEPYHAILISKDKYKSISCSTIFSKISDIGSEKIKTSYIVVSLNSRNYSHFKNVPEEDTNNFLEEVIKQCNSIIMAYQSIPTRHNHFMHTLSVKEIPYSLQIFTFNYKSGEIYDRQERSISNLYESDLFNSREIDDDELDTFRINHALKSRYKNELFELISIYNDAVNLGCIGKYSNSIVLVDNYTEWVFGYLFLNISICCGLTLEEATINYEKLTDSKKLMTSIAKVLGIKLEELLVIIGFDDWNTHCRKVRNNFVHQFLSKEIDSEMSFLALYYSAKTIKKFCVFILESEFDFMDDKLNWILCTLIDTASYTEIINRYKDSL